MKLQTSKYKAHGTGMTEVSSFRMDMNGKATRVLSDTLYTDKFGAIVRELSCNAFDAHVEAGKADVPFQITLPDAFNPQLRIRDFGHGISPENIKNVYCVYFGSTKDDSNEGVGAFGLGSKTPFAYTDAFMVTSIYEGVKRIYSVYMTEGTPIISLCSEDETDEPSGLEVVVTVEREDFSSFRDAVVKQLRFFPIKPEVNADINWPDVKEMILEVDGFSFFKTDNKLLEGFFIKQGPVAYPVDFEVLENYYRNKLDRKVPTLVEYLSTMKRSPHYWRRDYKGAVLDMPIGTVEVVPSREGVSYKNDTLNNIVTALEKVSDNLFKTVEQNFYNKYKAGYSDFISYFESLDGFMREAADAEYMEKNFSPFTIRKNGDLGIVMPEKFNDGIEITKYVRDRGPYRRMVSINTGGWKNKVDINNGIPIRYEDSNMRVSALEFLLTKDEVCIKDDNYAFLQRSTDVVNGNRFFLVSDVGCGQKTLDEFITFAEQFTTVYRVSDQPRPSRGSGHSTTGGRKRSWFYVPRSKLNHRIGDMFEHTLYVMNFRQEYDETIKDYDGDRMLYITTHTNRVMFPDNNELKGMFAAILRYAAMVDDMTIVAIPKGDVAKADKSNHFVSLENYYAEIKDKLWTVIEDEINDMYKHRYYRRCNMAFSAIFELVDTGEFSGADSISIDVPDPDTADTKLTVLSAYRSDFLVQVFEDAGRTDMINKYKELESVMYDSTSVNEVEAHMIKNGIDFVSLVDTIQSAKDMLERPDNARKLIKAFITINEYDNYLVHIYDPWNSNAVLLDSRKIACQFLDDLA